MADNIETENEIDYTEEFFNEKETLLQDGMSENEAEAQAAAQVKEYFGEEAEVPYIESSDAIVNLKCLEFEERSRMLFEMQGMSPEDAQNRSSIDTRLLYGDEVFSENSDPKYEKLQRQVDSFAKSSGNKLTAFQKKEMITKMSVIGMDAKEAYSRVKDSLKEKATIRDTRLSDEDRRVLQTMQKLHPGGKWTTEKFLRLKDK